MWNKCKKCGIFVDNNSRCGQNAAAFCMGGDFARLNYAHRRGSPCNKQNQLWECALRSSPEGDRKALWSPPQRRNPCNKKDQHREKTTSPDAGQSRPSGATMLNRLKEQFGGASADAQSYCAGTLRCLRPSCHTTLFSWSRFNGVTVGALPQTPAGTLSLHPARDIVP